jgi:flavodoxin/NAD-dependent dihydropyrimidine dehydrogenase PreA subunit
MGAASTGYLHQMRIMSKTEIYYFTGTGNSLAVARDIAGKLNGQLISIPSVMHKRSIKTDADIIGIVFPVHYLFNGGIPFIIERFTKKLNNINKKYIFAVCTNGSGPGDTMKNLRKIIDSLGGKLSGGFAVKMPYNYILFNKLSEVAIDKRQKMFNKCKKKVEVIYEYVNAKKECRLETSDRITLLFIDFLGLRKIAKSSYGKKAGFENSTDLPFQKILHLMDRSFHYDEKCNNCGICSGICPMHNIKIISGRPSWQHRCVQCFACLHWCPKEAIQFGNKTSKGKRYHHPDVKLLDIQRQN